MPIIYGTNLWRIGFAARNKFGGHKCDAIEKKFLVCEQVGCVLDVLFVDHKVDQTEDSTPSS
jgi:hypothetical protein